MANGKTIDMELKEQQLATLRAQERFYAALADTLDRLEPLITSAIREAVDGIAAREARHGK